MADPKMMAAFAGPKPNADELDELDDDITTADDIDDTEDEEVARLDAIVEALDEEQAAALEECCDDLGEGLTELTEPLPEVEQEILLENIGTMLSDDLIHAMVESLGEIEPEEIEGMVTVLEELELFEDPARVAALFFHIGQLIDSGMLELEEDEDEADLEGGDEDSDEFADDLGGDVEEDVTA